MAFAYDKNDNLSSLTPPGRPAHRFVVDEAQRRSSYSPPPVDVSPSETVLTYDQDERLRETRLPGGEVLTSEYETWGRFQALRRSGGGALLEYGYSVDSGRVVSFDGATFLQVHRAFDGVLLRREETKHLGWDPIDMQVSWAYDRSFRLKEETIDDGSALTFAYNQDGFLHKSGPYTVSYRPRTAYRLSPSFRPRGR